MELPKNITQMGELNRENKIYIEDYVISYLKQLKNTGRKNNVAVAFYGKTTHGDAENYYFLYGAYKLEGLREETKFLTQTHLQEIERLQKKYFPEYIFCGYAILRGDSLEEIMLWQQDMCFAVQGYARFYEKNDSMLEVMLSIQKDRQPENQAEDRYEMARIKKEERKMAYEEERMREKEKVPLGVRFVRGATVCVFLMVCISIAALIAERKGIEIPYINMGDFWGEEEEIQEEDSSKTLIEVGSIVAEDALEEAIRKENQNQAIEVNGSNVEVNPKQTVIVDESVVAEETVIEETKVEEIVIEETKVEETVIEDTEVKETVEEILVEETEAMSMDIEEPKGEYYEIQKGDTLINISILKYGNASYVKKICEMNNIKNPDNIQMGQKILLP